MSDSTRGAPHLDLDEADHLRGRRHLLELFPYLNVGRPVEHSVALDLILVIDRGERQELCVVDPWGRQH